MSLIKKEVIITIDGKNASLNENIYLYQGDMNIDILFTITDAKFKFNEYSGNILVESTARYGIVKVLKPDGKTFTSTKLPISDNKVVLTITQDFIDEITEVGIHIVQIQLWDSDNGRVTIPPINFEVLAPIF